MPRFRKVPAEQAAHWQPERRSIDAAEICRIHEREAEERAIRFGAGGRPYDDAGSRVAGCQGSGKVFSGTTVGTLHESPRLKSPWLAALLFPDD